METYFQCKLHGRRTIQVKDFGLVHAIVSCLIWTRIKKARGPQIPMTEGATGVPTPPVVPTVVHLPPVLPPGASEQDLRGAI
ncbi:hypothetical protein MTR67_018927 [Solanum verrucosum]|uniref:Uncharacterized protein n=1 Tax=Solanum verrucosum TaxID=315347 RepID=A0AAF0QKK1_SOLVR|nr:hypothetical protein MTR67_018927 [Solanum verrucosum]